MRPYTNLCKYHIVKVQKRGMSYWNRNSEYNVHVSSDTLGLGQHIVESALKFSSVTLIRMLSVQNNLLVPLVLVIPIFPIPFQKQCSTPGHSQHGTNDILDRKHIPLKIATSEYRIRDERRIFCTGCTTLHNQYLK